MHDGSLPLCLVVSSRAGRGVFRRRAGAADIVRRRGPRRPPAYRRLRPPRAATVATARPSSAPVPLDRVIAIVNDEALTQYELDEHKRIVLAQMNALERAPAAAGRVRGAGARAPHHRSRAPAVRQGQRRAGRRPDGRAHHPAHRAGEQDHAGRSPAHARSREDPLREVPRGHPARDHAPAPARAGGRQQMSRSPTPRWTTTWPRSPRRPAANSNTSSRTSWSASPIRPRPTRSTRAAPGGGGAGSRSRTARISARSPRRSPTRRTPFRAATSDGARRRGCPSVFVTAINT